MKNKRVQIARLIGAIFLSFAITAGNHGMNEVSAGASDMLVDNSSFATTLDMTKWNVPNGDINAEKGKIIFSSESIDGTRLIAKSAALVSEYHEELFSADYTIKLKSLPQGTKFLVAFALDTIESSYGETGNIELVFENDGGLKASLVTYDDNGETVVLAAPQSVGASMGKNIQINADATTDKKLTIKINGKTIYNKVVSVDLEGRLGLLVTGSCEAEVSRVNIVSHRYDRPENTNISEDFESGTINVNALSSRMRSSCGYYPAGLQIEEFEGSNVLMFRNVGMGYIGTVHQYSNFEISFDVPYMLHRSVMREDGTQLRPYHAAFVITFGDDMEDYTSSVYKNAPEAVIFTKNSVNRQGVATDVATFAAKDYLSEDKNTGYSVKMTVVDGQVTVQLKALDAKTYTDILTYKIGTSTPLGYVHLWSNGQGNFAVDNLKITNLDKNANLVDAGYQEGFATGTEDWVYEPQEVVYLDEVETEQEETEEKDFPWKLIVAGEVVLGIVIVAGSFVLMKCKKKTKKESVDINEG